MNVSDQYFDDRFKSPMVHSGFATLPFFHCCDGHHLQKILDKRRLETFPSKDYNNEKLLYLFYGRPAYKSSNQKNSRQIFLMPVCFVLNFNYIVNIKRIIPFDSGGFANYKRFLHKDMKLEDFQVTPDKNVLPRLVSYFYDSNADYYAGRPKESVPYDPIHFQVESYCDLIKDNGQDSSDDRKFTIEVQLDRSIELNSSSLDAIILPKPLSRSELVTRIITEEMGVKVIPIENYGVASNRYYVHLLETIKKILSDKNLL